MDITCPQCKTEYEFEDEKITVEGITVKCTNCDYIFKLRRKAVVEAEAFQATPTEAKPANSKPWMIRTAAGDVYNFKELTTLQQWIVERKVGREDQISRSGETWKRLGDIAELSSFFQVVDAASAAQNMALQSPPSPHPQVILQPGVPLTPAPKPPYVQNEPSFTSDLGQFHQVGPSAAWEASPNRFESPWEEDYFDELPRRRTGRTIGLILLILLLGAGGAFAYIMRDRLKEYLPSSFLQNSDDRNHPFYQAGRKLFLQDDEESLKQADVEFIKAPAQSALVKAARAEIYTTWAQHLRSQAEILERKANLIEAVKRQAEEKAKALEEQNSQNKAPAPSAKKAAPLRPSASNPTSLKIPEGDPKLLRIKASRLRDEAAKKLFQAEAFASAALNLGKDVGAVHRTLADYLRLMEQRPGEIETHLAEAKKLLPDDPETLYVQGANFAMLGQTSQAEELLKQSLAKTKARYGKTLLRAAFLLAMLQLKNNQLDLARAQSEAILQANPNHAWARVLLEALDEEAKYPAALVSAVKPAADSSSSAETEKPRATLEPAVPPAAAATRGASVPEKSSPNAPPEKTQASTSEGRSYLALIRQGNALSERGHTVKAFKIFELALKLKPEAPEALSGLGYCHLDQERFATAMSYFKRALAVSQVFGEALIGMAEAYKVQGNQAQALDYYKTYLRSHPHGPKSVMAQRNVVEIERKLGVSSPEPVPSPNTALQPSPGTPPSSTETTPTPAPP